MKLRSILATLMVAAMALGVVACGGTNGNASTDAAVTTNNKNHHTN